MSAPSVTVITARSTPPLLDLQELYRYRDLCYFLVLRDLQVRYRQTVIGGLWAIVQPLFSMALMSVVFGHLARMPSEGVPYPLFNYTGMVVWSYFGNVVATSANSMVARPELITKVYFPRILIPVTPVLSGLVDFTIAFVPLLAMILACGYVPSVSWGLLPVFVLMLALTACGTGLLAATVNAQYRDVRHALPFLLQMWFFSSPVIYPSSLIPAGFRPFYALNPIVGIVEGVRTILLGTPGVPASMLIPSVLSWALLLLLGLYVFRKDERQLADVI